VHPWPFQGGPPFNPHAEFLRIDGQSGTVRPLSSETLVQTGRRMKVSPDGRSLLGADGSIFAADRNVHGIIRVDPQSGAQTLVTVDGNLRAPSDVVVAPDGSLLVSDAVADVIVRVDPVTGQQTVVHSGTPGPRSPCVFLPTVAAPSLTIQLNTSGAVIRWVTTDSAWRLESQADQLGADLWADTGWIPVVAPVSGSRRFFRLSR
jgi:sugar lactone lactonase YvrE